MPMSEEYVKKLKIPQMVEKNTDNHETAFTVSIDHITTSTGILLLNALLLLSPVWRKMQSQRIFADRTYVPVTCKEKWRIRKKWSYRSSRRFMQVSRLKRMWTVL